MNGALVYVELPIHDVDETLRFYRTLFGWKITESFLSEQRYFMFETPTRSLSGGFDAKKKPAKNGPTLYVGCADINALLPRIDDFKNAHVVKPRTAVGGDYGYYALIEDPSGNVIGLQEDEKDA